MKNNSCIRPNYFVHLLKIFKKYFAMKKLFILTVSELVSFCKMVRDSLVRDLADFTIYKPKYDNAFVTALNLRIADLTDLVENKIKIGEVKKLTEALYALADGLRPFLTSYEGYVEDASGLSVGIKDFRFKQVRDAIGERDIDLLVIEVQTTWKLMDDNLAKIQPEGYTDEMHSSFKVLIEDIDTKNTERNLKVDEKEAMIQANMMFLNSIYKDIMKIAKDGKRIYKYTNPEKTGDYTMMAIRRRISNIPVKKDETLKEDAIITGIAMDFETEAPMLNVKIWTNNHTTAVYSDVNGVYTLKVNAETLTTLYAAFENYEDYEDDVEVEAGVTMELNIEMEKVEVEPPV